LPWALHRKAEDEKSASQYPFQVSGEAYAKAVCSLAIASIKTSRRFAKVEPRVTAPHANNPSTNSIAFVFNPAQSRVTVSVKEKNMRGEVSTNPERLATASLLVCGLKEAVRV
jgi:hypothetical protein